MTTENPRATAPARWLQEVAELFDTGAIVGAHVVLIHPTGERAVYALGEAEPTPLTDQHIRGQ